MAYLLSTRENKHSEALALISQARQNIGPHPVLLDTEALILLNSRQSPEELNRALKLMQDVVAQEPSGSAYFHLAQVELALNHDIDARAAWREAQERGLKPGDLHPLERESYDKLKEKLR